MKRINEIETIKKRYNLKSYEVIILHFTVIIEEWDLNYEKAKAIFIKKRQSTNKQN